MRIETIALHNFGSFADCAVDLRQISAGVVTGGNGSGKSTLFVDSILWALFGQCRTESDQMMRLGAVEMSVTVQFLLTGQQYRVVRKRSLHTQRGKSDLSLQIAHGDEWEDASGARLTDTQGKICSLLNMDAELLVSTGMLVQGSADKFSRATSSERKAILAQILRLDQYGPLKQAATRHLTIAGAKHGEKAGQLIALDAEAATVPNLEAQQAEISGAVVESNKAVEQLEQHQQALTTKKATLAAELEQLTAIPAQIAAVQVQQSDLRRDQETKAARRERAAKILGNRATIEAAVQQEAVTKEFEVTVGDEWTQLSAEMALAKHVLIAEQEQLDAIPAQRARVRSQRETLRTQQDEITARRERAAKILSERATIDAKVKEEEVARRQEGLIESERSALAGEAMELGRALTEIRLHLSEGIELERQVVKAEAEVDRQVQRYVSDTQTHETALTVAKKSVAFLETVPCGSDLQRTCPFTIQAVKIQETMPAKEQAFQERFVGDHRASIATEACEALRLVLTRQSEWSFKGYDEDAAGLVVRIQTVSAQQHDCEARRAANRDRLAALVTFTALVPELATAEREVAQVDLDLAQRARECALATQELEQLQQRATDREHAMLQIEERITDLAARLGACETQRRTNQTTLKDLAILTALVPELASAEREVASVDQDLARLTVDLGRLSLDLNGLHARLADRTRLTTERDRLANDWQQDATYLARLRSDGQAAIGRLKELELEIKRAHDAGRQAEQLRQECESLRIDGRHFQALATAYAQIPVLILESSIPLLEEEANRILGKISSSGMTVRLDTQKALKSGDGLAETLDIIVRDVFGERSYAAFSGGEKARIDLSLRIGLSRLLANRAGARIETMVVDEAFAAVDREGIEQLVECLPMLSQEFGCLLMITHDETFKSSIAQQIIVTKTNHGSQVEVIA